MNDIKPIDNNNDRYYRYSSENPENKSFKRNIQ